MNEGITEGVTEGCVAANDAVNVNDKPMCSVINHASSLETHFVYVYVSSPAKWNELSVSIQSIRQNFRGAFKIFVVGDQPNIKGIIHIPAVQIKGTGSKPKDAARKLRTIIDCPLINDDFVYCYDDVVLLKPISAEWFKKIIAIDHVSDYVAYWGKAKGIIPDKGWRSLFSKTFMLLSKKTLPSYNYETHLPRMLNKAKLIATFAKFGDACEDALFNSLYFNLHYKQPDILLKNDQRIKAGCHRAYENPDKLINELRGKVWLNYSDPALNDTFKKTINKFLRGEIKL